MRWALVVGVAAFLASAAPIRGQNNQSSAKTEENDARGPIDVLSDTKGFNIKPYVKTVTRIVRSKWYFVMPNVAQAPKREQGYVVIDFRVLKDGQIKDLKYHVNSEDPKLDRAAYAAISESGPLPTLPSEFECEFIKMRFHFFYNESPGDVRDIELKEPGGQVVPCVTTKVLPIGESTLEVSPGSIQVAAGTKTQFYAKISGLVDSAVTWSVTGPGCENSACGVISTGGLYTAPAEILNRSTITVTATLIATPSESASSKVTIVSAGGSH